MVYTSDRRPGAVKWFNDAKSFGFIAAMPAPMHGCVSVDYRPGFQESAARPAGFVPGGARRELPASRRSNSSLIIATWCRKTLTLMLGISWRE